MSCVGLVYLLDISRMVYWDQRHQCACLLRLILLMPVVVRLLCLLSVQVHEAHQLVPEMFVANFGIDRAWWEELPGYWLW